MEIKSLCLSAICLISVGFVQAGEILICKDEWGNPYFTNISCDKNKAALTRIYVPDAPTSQYSPTAEEQNEEFLREFRNKNRRKLYRRREAELYAPKPPTWAERTAARNSRISANNQRWLDEARGEKRNAADWAHQYNTASVADGGKHQVRVPDVINITTDGDYSGKPPTYKRRYSRNDNYMPGGAPYSLPATGGSFAERTAARNSRISANNQRELDDARGEKRNAADWAHQYNTNSIAEGGTHQVRVPDVTNIHIQRATNPRNGRVLTPSGKGMIDPVTREYFFRSGRGYIGAKTGAYVPAP